MTIRCGNGFIKLAGVRVQETGETALECKARVAVGRKVKTRKAVRR